MNKASSSVVLFDLDNTLLPIDSDHAWGNFLVELGIVDKDHYQSANNFFYEAYKAGTLDIHQFLDFALEPLAKHSRKQLEEWHKEFMRVKIEPNIREDALNLVHHHLSNGDLCVVVTATNSFVTKPIATRFGITNLIATEPEENRLGEFTGKVKGLPNFQQGKVIHVEHWLKDLGLNWENLANSVFYSDSMNDLPLLEKVKTPIATNPDPRLESIAKERSWKIINLFS